jgi:hypothetical protein
MELEEKNREVLIRKRDVATPEDSEADNGLSLFSKFPPPMAY